MVLIESHFYPQSITIGKCNVVILRGWMLCLTPDHAGVPPVLRTEDRDSQKERKKESWSEQQQRPTTTKNKINLKEKKKRIGTVGNHQVSITIAFSQLFFTFSQILYKHSKLFKKMF